MLLSLDFDWNEPIMVMIWDKLELICGKVG
jgi:hypothetical protein